MLEQVDSSDITSSDPLTPTSDVESSTRGVTKKREAFVFRFNKAKYDELKQKGFRLEF